MLPHSTPAISGRSSSVKVISVPTGSFLESCVVWPCVTVRISDSYSVPLFHVAFTVNSASSGTASAASPSTALGIRMVPSFLSTVLVNFTFRTSLPITTSAVLSSPTVTSPDHAGTPQAMPLPFVSPISSRVTTVPFFSFSPKSTEPFFGTLSSFCCG